MKEAAPQLVRTHRAGRARDGGPGGASRQRATYGAQADGRLAPGALLRRETREVGGAGSDR